MTDGLRKAKLHILQHSLGVDDYGRGRRYRNHFCTGPGSIDYENCLALVADGMMRRHAPSPLTGGDDLFTVTPAGERFVTEYSPQPPPEPKLTRSQKRYQEFLDADCGYSFREWLGLYHGSVRQ